MVKMLNNSPNSFGIVPQIKTFNKQAINTRFNPKTCFMYLICENLCSAHPQPLVCFYISNISSLVYLQKFKSLWEIQFDSRICFCKFSIWILMHFPAIYTLIIPLNCIFIYVLFIVEIIYGFIPNQVEFVMRFSRKMSGKTCAVRAVAKRQKMFEEADRTFWKPLIEKC